MQPEEIKPIKFPEDELAHDFIAEWWYFNGSLKDREGREYSFMNCLFKVDVKKVKIHFLNKIPLKTSYFSHSLISDITNQNFQQRVSPFSVISDGSFTRPLLYVNYANPEIGKDYINCVIEKIEENKFHIRNEDLDLELITTKEPLLESGKGFVDVGSKTSYYYSLTNLKTTGKIKINGEWLDVSGKSWMDHQWTNMPYNKDRWDWFSVQLENETELVCFMYDNGKTKKYFADISYPDGRQEHFDQVEIVPTNISEKNWVSPKSKAVYPLEWTIGIPAKEIVLKIKARVPNQEMLFGSINYWEGSLSVTGSFAGQSVKGVGFMELVGYPSEYSNVKFIKDEIEKVIGKFVFKR